MICFFVSTNSCSKKKVEAEAIYTEAEFLKLAEELTALNPIGENAIPWSEYSPNVNKVISKTYVYKRLKFYAIGFNSVEEARLEAVRLNQFYAKNFVFDQVFGEPVLEDYLIHRFSAVFPKNPNHRKIKSSAQHGSDEQKESNEKGVSHEVHHKEVKGDH